MGRAQHLLISQGPDQPKGVRMGSCPPCEPHAVLPGAPPPSADAARLWAESHRPNLAEDDYIALKL